MLNNYMNPGSMKPDYDWKPDNFLAGMQWSQDSMNYDYALKQQSILQNLALARQQMENQDYAQAAPFRQSQRDMTMAQNNARIPIQPNLAASERATADVNTEFARPRAQISLDKEKTERMMGAKAWMGEYLAALLDPNSKLPPAEIAMKWKGEGYPMLKRILGEDVPEFENASPAQLQAIAQMTRNPAKHQQTMQVETLKGDKDIERAHVTGQYGVQEAGIRAAASARERHTAAAEAAARLQQYIEAATPDELRALQAKHPQADPNQLLQEARRLATLKALSTLHAGNPMGRAAAEENKQLGVGRAKLTLMEKFTASDLPKDRAKLEKGKVYKLPNGQYGRFAGDDQIELLD
jgi:hypothetical protein